MKNEQLFLASSLDYGGENKSPKDLKASLMLYVHYWPIFLVSLGICCTLAFFYVRRSRPVYDVKAKLSIKDDKAGADEKDVLDKINITGTPKNIESELEIIKSRTLLKEVVNNLQLWASYGQVLNYAHQDLYLTTPVHFNLVKQTGPLKDENFTVQVESTQYYLLKSPDGKSVRAPFNRTFESTFGTWKLDTTDYIKDFIGKTITIGIQNPEDIVSDYQNRVVATLNKDNAPIIELELVDEIPQRAVSFLNELIKSYKIASIDENKRVTQSTLKFIDDRLASLTGELNVAEQDVAGYKSSIGLTDISSRSKFYLDNVQTNDAKLNDVNVQLNVIEGIESYVNSKDNSGSPPATIGISDPGLISLVDQLGRLELQRDKLLATTPEQNPIFDPLNRQIASVKSAIKSTVAGIKNTLTTTLKQLKGYNSGFEASIKDIPDQEKQYVGIKRQQSIKEGLYIYLLQKKEETSLNYAAILTGIRTVEEPYYEQPQSKKQVPYLLAIILGIGLPAAVIYGLSLMKNRVLSTTEIELGTLVPIIGELNQHNSKSPLVVLERNAFLLGEQFRSLRTALQSLYLGKPGGKVTMITSSVSGEGKSFVTSNMGLAIAATGKKTVIIELDLRRPQIGSIFKIKNSQLGLTDYLVDHATKKQIIHPSGVLDNLSVITAGFMPENPSELLDNYKLDDLINELKEEYDSILIDTPPMHLVTDGMILSRLCDVTLYLVKQGHTDRTELKFIKDLHKKNKLPNLHIIFNGIERQKYGYGYNYDNSYYNNSNLRKQLV